MFWRKKSLEDVRSVTIEGIEYHYIYKPGVRPQHNHDFQKHGLIVHREGDRPAIIVSSTHKIWCIHGRMHRDGDKPARISGDFKYWYKNGLIHREDKPAIIFKDREQWFLNGMRHRYDGPAISGANDYGVSSWRLWGEPVREEEYLGWLDSMGMDIDNLTPEDKVMIDLKWKTN